MAGDLSGDDDRRSSAGLPVAPAAAGFSLGDGLELTGARVQDIWWRYAALGGRSSVAAFSAAIDQPSELDAWEHDLIAQALNEEFHEQGLTMFPVGYVGDTAIAPGYGPQPLILEAVRSARAGRHCGQDAAAARQRSADAHARAIALQATAARLMKTSGQLQFAARAQRRAVDARARLDRALGVS